MKVDSKVTEYLRGGAISNGARLQISRNPVWDRNSLLVSMARDKNVLHMGCADHVELIEEKRQKGRYLHGLLAQSARYLAGTDVNRAAIAEMERSGISGLYHVSELPPDQYFDVLLVPDVIEHVGNVEEFLVGLKKINAGKIVITTPNAFRLKNRSLFRSELVNSDHRYWFSPYTLSKSIYESGYEIEAYFYTDRLRWWQPIRSFLKWYFPLCRDGIAVVINRS